MLLRLLLPPLPVPASSPPAPACPPSYPLPPTPPSSPTSPPLQNADTARISVAKDQTFLESLTDAERNALLRGAPIFYSHDYHSSLSTSSASQTTDPRVSSTRTELPTSFPGSIPPSPTSPGVSSLAPSRPPRSLSPPSSPYPERSMDTGPMARTTQAEKDMIMEVSVLRVQRQALEAENAKLRDHSLRVVEQLAKVKEQHGNSTLTNKQRELVDALDNGKRLAELEEVVTRMTRVQKQLEHQEIGRASCRERV